MNRPVTSTEQSPVCITCRNRRVRCDRERPICGPCRKTYVPCRYTHGSRARRRGRPRLALDTSPQVAILTCGRRMSGGKLDDYVTSATNTSPASPSTVQTGEQINYLEFVNISQPLDAGKVENRAMVRSHVMRNYKQRQRIQRSLAGGDDDIGAQILPRPTKLSRRCICTTRPRSRASDGFATDIDIVLDSQSQVLPAGRSAVTEYDTIQQLLPADQMRATMPSSTDIFCGNCGGSLMPEIYENFEFQAISDQHPYFRRDIFDPFDTLRSSTSRIELRKLVHHSISALWPSLCPLGTFDPMDKIFRPLVISDELLFHANFFNAGFHLSALEGKEFSVEGARHRTETIKVLNKRLEDPQQAISDATIAAVTSFLAQAIVNRNTLEIHIHADGLFKMVTLAGGLEQLGGLGGLLQELVYWTELCAAAVTNTEPRFAHPTTHRRLTTLPIFTAPRCPISKMGRGFREIFPVSKPDLTRPFDDLLELINQVRCLGWILHISHSCGRPRVRLASFLARGASVKRRMFDLPNLFGVTEEGDDHGLGIRGSRKHLFECLRYATLIFLEFVLAEYPPAAITRSSPSSSTFDTLTSGLVANVQKLDMHKVRIELAGFFFWVFGMGAIGASGSEATRAYFKGLTDCAGRWVGISSWPEARSAWIRFMAVEAVLDGPLRRLWAEVERRRVNKLILPQRLMGRAESSKEKRMGAS